MGKPSCSAGRACGRHSAAWLFSAASLTSPDSQALPHPEKRILCEFNFSVFNMLLSRGDTESKRQWLGFNRNPVSEKEESYPPRPSPGPAFNTSVKVEGKQENSPPLRLWPAICRARAAGFLGKIEPPLRVSRAGFICRATDKTLELWWELQTVTDPRYALSACPSRVLSVSCLLVRLSVCLLSKSLAIQ